MKYFLLAFILFAVLFSVPAFSQSPGGVGVSDGLSVWLRADAGTASAVDGSATGNWIDQSGNSNDYTVVGTPSLETQELNFNPSIQIIGHTGFNAPPGAALSAQNSVIFVSKKLATDVNGRLFTANTGNFLWGYHDVKRNSIYINGNPNEYTTGIAVAGEVQDFHLFSYLHSGTSSLEARADGHSLKTFTGPINSAAGARVDINQGNFSGSQRSNSQVGEFITYDTALSILQRQKVESYLALKYGFTLNQGVVSNYIATNNVIYWTGDVAYQYDIFGIGKDDNTALHQKVSKSTNSDAIVTIATNADFTSSNQDPSRADIVSPISYLMVGNNNASTGVQTTELDAAFTYTNGINREWKVQTSNFSQTVNLKFDGFSTSSGQTVYLIKKNGDDDFSTGTTQVGALDGNGEISGISFNNNDYFTLAAESLAPGGVIGGNYMWLRTDSGFSGSIWQDTWSLHNMNQGTVTNQPTLIPLSNNFNPAISFNGISQWMGAADNLFMTTNYSIYAVYSTTDAQGALFAVTGPVSPAAGSHDRQFGMNATGRFSNRIWSEQTIVSPSAYNDGVPKIFNNRVSNSTTHNPLNGQENNVNGVTVVSGTKNASNFNYEGGFVLGGHNAWGYLNATLQEFIIFDKDLTDIEKNRVDSYLAIKYGVTLGSTSSILNYIASDGSTVFWNGDATYQNNVFGIGRDNDPALHQKVSKSVNSGSILTLATSSDFTSANLDMARSDIPTTGAFFMIGDNNGNTSLSATVLNSISPNLLRINRVWKTQDTGGLSCINYRFNTSSFSASATQDWYVVIADNDTFTTDVEIHSITVGGNVDLSMDLDNDTSNFITLARLDRDDVAVSDTGGVVGINTDDPADNTYLDIRGGNKGLVITRLDQTAIDGLTTVEGMFVFNTTTNVFQLYDGTSWRALGTPSNSKFCD